MEDLRRINHSAVDTKDLADLAEYHRFLEQFQMEAAQAHKDNLLFGDVRLFQPGKRS
jgi:hypothetical protein